MAFWDPIVDIGQRAGQGAVREVFAPVRDDVRRAAEEAAKKESRATTRTVLAIAGGTLAAIGLGVAIAKK